MQSGCHGSMNGKRLSQSIQITSKATVNSARHLEPHIVYQFMGHKSMPFQKRCLNNDASRVLK